MVYFGVLAAVVGFVLWMLITAMEGADSMICTAIEDARRSVEDEIKSAAIDLSLSETELAKIRRLLEQQLGGPGQELDRHRHAREF